MDKNITIQPCIGIIFQKGKIKGYLHSVKVIIEKVPLTRSPLPQPFDICKEVSGVMKLYKKVNFINPFNIEFIYSSGEMIEGLFYISPAKIEGRTFFELDGALTLTR